MIAAEAEVVVGVSGLSVNLPCYTNTSEQGGDRANLVLWFRDQQLHPFYTWVDTTSYRTPVRSRDDFSEWISITMYLSSDREKEEVDTCVVSLFGVLEGETL